MRWSNFFYLIPALLIALPLLLLLARMVPALSKPSKRRTRAEVALIVLLVAFGLVVIYGNFYVSKTYFVFGISDVGSDTYVQYYPFYLWLVDSVREGSLRLWTWNFEMGVNLQTFQSWLFDPFNLIVVPLTLLLGDAKLSLALAVAQSAKILLAALLFDHLLTRFCETPLARLLGSLLYAFSGFAIMWGQHYWFGAALPLFTATLLVFELYLERPGAASFVRVAAVVALQLAWSAYVSFMILLGAAIYLLFRIPAHLERPSVAAYLRSVVMLFVPVVAGLLVSAVSWLPYANFLMNETARINSSSSESLSLAQRTVAKLGAFVHADWVPAILSRMVGTSLLTTGADTSPSLLPSSANSGFVAGFPYEFILLGYSCGVFVLLSQFFHWLFAEIRGATRVLVLGATAVVCLYCFHEFLPSAFNLMVGTQYRSSFVLATPFCIAMALGFEKRVLPGKTAKAPLVVALVLTGGVLLWSLLNTLNGRLVCVFYLAALLCLGGAILLAERRLSWQPLLMSLVVALTFASSVVDGLFATNCRGLVEPGDLPHVGTPLEETATSRALAYLAEHDDTLFRVDKTYVDWWFNDSLIQHYASVSAYNSAPDADVDRFYHQLWEESIFGSGVYSQAYSLDADRPQIASLLGIKYVLSREPLDYAWLAPVTVVGTQADSVYVYENTASPSLATLRERVVSEAEADALADSAARRELLDGAVIVPDEVASALEGQLADAGEGVTPTSEASAAPSSADAVPSPTFYADSESALHGSLQAQARSVVCLAIPHTGSWHVLVDGEEVETFRANYGFSGFVVEAGAHEVTAFYQLDGLMPGCICSGVGLVFVVACAILARRLTAAR
jgi:uncharacterized membrane protein YfhO